MIGNKTSVKNQRIPFRVDEKITSSVTIHPCLWAAFVKRCGSERVARQNVRDFGIWALNNNLPPSAYVRERISEYLLPESLRPPKRNLETLALRLFINGKQKTLTCGATFYHLCGLLDGGISGKGKRKPVLSELVEKVIEERGDEKLSHHLKSELVGLYMS